MNEYVEGVARSWISQVYILRELPECGLLNYILIELPDHELFKNIFKKSQDCGHKHLFLRMLSDG